MSRHSCVFRVVNRAMRLRDVPFWMIRFLSCHRDGKRIAGDGFAGDGFVMRLPQKVADRHQAGNVF